MTIVYWGVGWFVGIWLASVWSLPLWAWLLAALLGLAGMVLLRRRQALLLLPVILAAVGGGGARYTTAVPTIDPGHVAYYNDSGEVTLTGIVSDEPDVRDRSVNLRVAVESLALPQDSAQPVSGDILVRTARFPVIPYGARLQLTGSLEAPPDEEDFSYRDYLARQGIHSLLPLPQVDVLAEGAGSPLYHAIFAFKARAQATINQILPDPQAALLSGILLGNDNGLPPDLADDFRATGMTHIIAISGFNIAILIAILVSITEPLLPKRVAMLVAILGVALYTLLVGADASVVRAAIMGAIFLVASRLLGRPNFAYASLFVAGFAMTLVNPMTLWDVGFQLSFTATLGLMLYADPFTQWTRRQLQRHIQRDVVERIMGVISEAVLITLAAQVLTLPLMMGYFGQLSLISLPANAFILPAQPGVMVWGGLATLAGLIFPALGQLLGWVAWLFLTYTIALVRLFAAVPGAVVDVAFPATAVIALYLLIAALTWLAKQSAATRQQLLGTVRYDWGRRVVFSGSLIVVLLTSSWSLSQPDGLLHVIFFDVGQGDATFIQTPSGRQILIDGGYYPSVLNDQLGRQVPFWDREIDLVIATHPDADHVSGLVGVFDRYRVGQLITNGDELGESQIYDAVLQAAEAHGTPVHAAQAGEVITIEDGVRLEIVHPHPGFNVEDRNERSVSMRLVYGDFTFLFTGDAEQQGEQAMLQSERPLQALVFKAGHHGSNSSSTQPLLAAVQPKIVVVSAGAENRFGHPAPEMLQRAQAIGAGVLRTDELGPITVMSNGQEMWWEAGP